MDSNQRWEYCCGDTSGHVEPWEPVHGKCKPSVNVVMLFLQYEVPIQGAAKNRGDFHPMGCCIKVCQCLLNSLLKSSLCTGKYTPTRVILKFRQIIFYNFVKFWQIFHLFFLISPNSKFCIVFFSNFSLKFFFGIRQIYKKLGQFSF